MFYFIYTCNHELICIVRLTQKKGKKWTGTRGVLMGQIQNEKGFAITGKEWTLYKSTYGRVEKRGEGFVIHRKEWTKIQGKNLQEDAEDWRRLR